MIEDTSGQDRSIEPRFKYLRWITLGGIVIVLAVAIWLSAPMLTRWSQAELSVASERVRLGTVKREDLIHDIAVQATVVAGDSPSLYSEHAGNVSLLVNVGDRVQDGQSVAQLANPFIVNRLAQERANYNRIKIEVEHTQILNKQTALANQRSLDQALVNLTAAKREARRAEAAHSTNAISDIDWEKAQDDLTSAQFAHDYATSFLDLDQDRMDFELNTRQLALESQALVVEDMERQADELNIRSPIEGIVGNILVEHKNNIEPGTILMTIVDTSLFELDAQVAESYADEVQPGMRAEVMIDGEPYIARVDSVSPEIVDNEVLVRLTFDERPATGLRRNQRLTTRIFIQELPDVLVAPRGQFISSGGGRIAYVVDQQGIAKRTNIRIGTQSSSAVEILSGLSEGDRIILSSTDPFRNSETVLITD